MLLSRISESIPRKMAAIVLGVALVTLTIAALLLLAYNLRSYRDALIDDLGAQAEIIGLASAPALVFNDRRAALENIQLLKARPSILAAAVYQWDGTIFASLARDQASEAFPPRPERAGYEISERQIVVVKHISDGDEILGTVYLKARYEWVERIMRYLTVLGGVMLLSLTVAFVLAQRLQRAITQPLLAVSAAARDVVTHRDFSRRVEKTTQDEIGYVIDAFNAMLEEVGKRTAELETADRRKDEFLATLAHELRNPLAPLRNALELQRLHGEKPAVLQQTREIMERQVTHMVQLINDLLDLSRITTGRIELQRQIVSIDVVLRNALESVNASIVSRKQELNVSLPAEPLLLEGDPVRLTQVFSNVLHNATKYTPSSGRIDVRARHDINRALVTVTDTGIGIAQDMLPAIFDMFTQVDRSLEQSRGGLGIGLALTKKLLDLHGGTIKARSAGVGQGSEFTICLPLAAVATDAAAGPAATAGARVFGRHRVLVVDDNRDYADSLALLLKDLGCEVHVAYDGEQAWNMANRTQPEIAFVDIGMPKMNGYELAQRFRESSSLRHCTLVAVTGWGQPKDKQRAMAAGFDRHVLKPIEPEQLRSVLVEYESNHALH